jgi:hypothetical protein
VDSGEEGAEDSAEEGAEGGRNKGESDDAEDKNAGIDGSGSDRSEDSVIISIDNGNDIERIEV